MRLRYTVDITVDPTGIGKDCLALLLELRFIVLMIQHFVLYECRECRTVCRVTSRRLARCLRRFGQFADRFADCFCRDAQRDAASRYLDALFNDSERKSMQAMHGRLSDPCSYEALQHFITDSLWEAELLWTRLRAFAPVRTGILALDDTSFPKQGKHSVAVKRQYCGTLGKIANCQVAVSTVLLDDRLAWPLTFELYMPHEWLTDEARHRKARVPDTMRFREKRST